MLLSAVSLRYLSVVKVNTVPDFHLSGFEQSCQLALVPKHRKVQSNTNLQATLAVVDCVGFSNAVCGC